MTWDWSRTPKKRWDEIEKVRVDLSRRLRLGVGRSESRHFLPRSLSIQIWSSAPRARERSDISKINSSSCDREWRIKSWMAKSQIKGLAAVLTAPITHALSGMPRPTFRNEWPNYSLPLMSSSATLTPKSTRSRRVCSGLFFWERLRLSFERNEARKKKWDLNAHIWNGSRGKFTCKCCKTVSKDA